MVSDRSRKIDNAVTRGYNFFMALVWLALGIGTMVAGASGIGGAFAFIVGLLIAMYALYGFGRHVFFRSR